MNQNKVLFLDVDGVLTTRRCWYAYDKGVSPMWDAWDPVAIAILHKVCQTGVQLVMSSTWRKDENKPELDAKLLQHGLDKYLLQPNWRTPVLEGYHDHHRAKEIAAYLAINPNVVDYRILDDECDPLPDQKGKVIATDADNGMTDTNIQHLFMWCKLA